MSTMEQQVAQAALAMVQPTTSTIIRSQASQFLEDWTRTPEAWELYIKWLQSFRYQHSQQPQPSQEEIGMQLLCFTLLHAKIRREVPRQQQEQVNQTHHYHPSLGRLRQELWEYLSWLQPPSSSLSATTLTTSLVQPCCNCNAALAVRCSSNDLGPLMSILCCQSTSSTSSTTPSNNGTSTSSLVVEQQQQEQELHPLIIFKLLTSIPIQIAACNDLTTSQISEVLIPYLELVLDTIVCQGLVTTIGLLLSGSSSSSGSGGGLSTTTTTSTMIEVLLPALQALQSWTNHCHVTITQLNTPTFQNRHQYGAVLPLLIQLLSISVPLLSSSSSVEDSKHLQLLPKLWQVTSNTLTEAIMVPSDHCTDTRQVAAGLLYHALSTTTTNTTSSSTNTLLFCTTPLAICTQYEWYDAGHAIATFVTTFVTEQVDDIVTQPATTSGNNSSGDGIIPLLLEIQNHPHIPIALTALECWLTIQEIPTEDRHLDWTYTLFGKVVQGLLVRITYPSNLPNTTTTTTTTTAEGGGGTTTTEEWNAIDYMDDGTEFEELRRMVTDVFVSSYYLLRSDYIQYVISRILNLQAQQQQQQQSSTTSNSSPLWPEIEAALFALCQVSKEVSSQLKSNGSSSGSGGNDMNGGHPLQDDQTTITSEPLLQLLQAILTSTNNQTLNPSSILLPNGATTTATTTTGLSSPYQVVQTQHIVVLQGLVEFCGCYAPVWNKLSIPPLVLLQLVSYLQSAFVLVPHDAAKAIRAIYIGCLAQPKTIRIVLLPSNNNNNKDSTNSGVELIPHVIQSIRESLQVVLAPTTTNETAMTTVVEGAIRFITQLPRRTTVTYSSSVKGDLAQQTLIQGVIHPLLHRAEEAWTVLTSPAVRSSSSSSSSSSAMSPDQLVAIERLVRYLAVAQVIVRFCDVPQLPSKGGGNNVESTRPLDLGQVAWQQLGPLLEQTGSCFQASFHQNNNNTIMSMTTSLLLPRWIAIHQQFLRTLPPSIVAPSCLQQIIPLCLQALNYTQQVSTLEYIAAAVEVLGSTSTATTTDQETMASSFTHIISHMTAFLWNHLQNATSSSEGNYNNNNNGAAMTTTTTTTTADTELIRAYFDCLNRFILYCPRPLVYHAEFATIVRVAVEVITIHCQQERDSTRATLHWLSHLFGWHVVRLSPPTVQVLASVKDRLSQLLLVVTPPTTTTASSDSSSLCHGAQLIHACIMGLIGGGPQMLWASYADCLYAILANLVIEPPPPASMGSSASGIMVNDGNDPTSTTNNNHAQHSPMVYQWLYASMTSTLSSNAGGSPHSSSKFPQSASAATADQDTLCQQVCTILLTMMQQQGIKSRPKAKMLLTDFAKIVSGEMAPNALVAYTLPA